MTAKINSVCAAALRAGVLSLFILAPGFPTAYAANASPPERMTYQGYLVDANGVALATNAPKNYDVLFRLYDDQSAGNKLWTEQQTLTVDKGYFSVLLGEGSVVGSEPHPAIPTLFTNATASDRFVEITVKGIGSGGTDSTILPRLRLLTSPYAFLAQRAVDAVNLQGSVNTAGGLTLNGSTTVSNLTVNGGNVGIMGTQTLEFGRGIAGKDGNAGKIGYNTFTTDALDIVGAGTTGGNRKIQLWAEGGVTANGPIRAPSLAVGDGSAYFTIKDIGGGVNPCINFDGNDWLMYLRAENEYDFRIATASRLRITSTNVVVSGSLVATNIVEKSDNRLGKGDVLLNLTVSTVGGSGSANATKTLDNIKSTYRYVLIYAHTSIHNNSMLVHVDDLIAGESYEMGKYTGRFVVVKPPTSGTGTAWTVELGAETTATVKVRGLY